MQGPISINQRKAEVQNKKKETAYQAASLEPFAQFGRTRSTGWVKACRLGTVCTSETASGSVWMLAAGLRSAGCNR